MREDAQLLYGFANKTERKLFRLLIKVNGVGPKLALAILSAMSADQFVSCVRHDDVSAIVKIPGVGKKTAERLLIEMRDRLKDWQVQKPSLIDADGNMPEQLSAQFCDANNVEDTFVNDEKGDAINALLSLGYKQAQADKAVKSVYKQGMVSQDIIRDALRSML